MLRSEQALDIPKAKRMKLRNLRDLLVVLVEHSDKTHTKLNTKVYCTANGGSKYFYYATNVMEGIYHHIGVPVQMYAESDVEPGDYLWWNTETNNIYSAASAKPKDIHRQDVTQVFPIVFVEELPDFLNVWRE
jgi:hypothetical protein